MNRAQRALSFVSSTVGINASILDVGCGYGESLALFKESGFSNLLGIDISEHAIASAQKTFPSISFRHFSEQLPVPDASQDVVLFLDVLEHVTDEERIVQEIARVLKPGGMLVLSVPYAGTTSFLDPANIRRAFTPSLQHHRHYSVQQLTTLLDSFFSIDCIELRGLGLSQVMWMFFFPIRKLGLEHWTKSLVQHVGEWDYAHMYGKHSYHSILLATRRSS